MLTPKKKKVQPFVTFDPNDPRFKSYNDSLINYNNEKKLYESESLEYAKKIGVTHNSKGVPVEEAYKYDLVLKAIESGGYTGHTPITSTEIKGFPKPKQEVVLGQKEEGYGESVSKTRQPIGSITVMGTAIPYYSESHKQQLVTKFTPYGLRDYKGDGNYSHSMIGNKFKGWSDGKLYDKKGNIIYQMAYGGQINNNLMNYGGELTEFNSGGTHEQNPINGIPIANGGQTKVEQGETKNGNYIFSDRLMIDDNIIEMFGLPKRAKDKSFAQFSKSINKKYTRENDAYENNAKQRELDKLKQAHEVKKSMFMQEMGLAQPEMQPQEDLKFLGGAMMAAPIVAEGINAIRTLNNKPKAKDLNMFNTDTEFNANLINRDQIKRDITSSEATAAYDIKNASGGNAGRYLGNRIALNNQANTNLAQANLQSDMADSQEYARVEGMSFNQDLQNQGKRMQVQNWNDADIAAWEGGLQDSIASVGQNIGGLGTQMVRNKLIKDAYGMGSLVGNKTNQPTSNNLNASNWKNPYTPESAAIAADEMMSMETAPEPPSLNTSIKNNSNRLEYESMSKVLSQQYKNLNWVERGLNPNSYPVINNEDGSVSTHKLAYATGDDGEAYIYPTIIQLEDGTLKQLSDKEAMEYAFKTKTAMRVPNIKLAEYYSQNGLIKH